MASLSGSVRTELERQRRSTEECISILADCRTREDVLDAFRRAGALLKQSGDPLGDAVQNVVISAAALTDSHVFRLRDDFLQMLRTFLSTTGSAR